MAGSWIDFTTLQRAHNDVREELFNLGLLTNRLEEVDVHLVSPLFPERFYGYYLEESPLILEWLGWEAGHI